jgi:uncharacterized membrane protein (UPF0127 family)
MIAVPTFHPPTSRRTDPHRRRACALLASLLLLPLGAGAQTAPIEDLDKFPRGKLEISLNRKQALTFDVWLADTPPRQSQGLMFVRSLPPQRGMLFVYQRPRQISMWMKNTYIPLDMVFIDAQRRIESIAERTTPHSLATVSSKGPALAVLEIAGGEARRLGLKPGQQVRHPALPNQ